MVEGSGSPVVKTTNYAYNASYQLDNSGAGAGQYGNLTRIAEYAGDTRPPGANPARLRLTERWYNTNDDHSSVMLATLLREERVSGATDSEVLGHTWLSGLRDGHRANHNP